MSKGANDGLAMAGVFVRDCLSKNTYQIVVWNPKVVQKIKENDLT